MSPWPSCWPSFCWARAPTSTSTSFTDTMSPSPAPRPNKPDNKSRPGRATIRKCSTNSVGSRRWFRRSGCQSAPGSGRRTASARLARHAGLLRLRRARPAPRLSRHAAILSRRIRRKRRAPGLNPVECRPPPRPRPKPARRFLELRIPGVPEQAAALALTTFRSLLRAPEVKMAWATSILVPLIVGGSLLFRSTVTFPEAAKPFMATGAVVFSVFMLVQFFANQFGFDRDGFRALVLSPVDRRLILLGKNLACLPVGALLRPVAPALDFAAAAPLPADVPGRPAPTGRRSPAGRTRRQRAFHPRALPHPTRHDEADQNARRGHVGVDALPPAFSLRHGCRSSCRRWRSFSGEWRAGRTPCP